VFGSESPVLQTGVSGDDLSYETSKTVREKNGEEEKKKKKVQVIQIKVRRRV